MPATTTIKVPIAVRDRLATAARTRGVTIRNLLEDLSRRALDAALIEKAGRQMAHVRDTDPEAWADYLRKGSEWEERTIERFDA